MEQGQKKLAQNAAIYSFFSLLQRGLGFFLLPVYTTVLATEQLGIISTVTATVAFFVLLFGLSFRGSIAYYYYEYKDTKPTYLKEIYGTSVSFIFLFTIVGILTLLATQSLILERLLKNIDFYPYIVLGLCSIFFQPLYFYYQLLLKAKQRAKKAAMLDFTYFGVMVVGTLLFILAFGMKAEGALLANAIASLVVFTISIIGLRSEIILCLKKALLVKVMKYALPILPHNISGWAMNMVDKIMLNGLTSLTAVALFEVGSQLGKVVNMISLGVNSAYSPWFFDQVKNHKDSKKTIAKVTHKIVLIYAAIAVSISWIAPELLEIISKPAYHDSWKVVPFIATAYIINGFYFTFSNVFFLENTKYLAPLTITGALVNIGLNFWLIPIYGYMGAAYASLSTKIVFSALTFVVSQRLFNIKYNMSFILGCVVMGFALANLPVWIQDDLSSLSLMVRLLIKASLISILFIPIIIRYRTQLRTLIKTRKK